MKDHLISNTPGYRAIPSHEPIVRLGNEPDLTDLEMPPERPAAAAAELQAGWSAHLPDWQGPEAARTALQLSRSAVKLIEITSEMTKIYHMHVHIPLLCPSELEL